MTYGDNFRKILAEFFSFTIYIRLLHWQTSSYALHKTTDALLVTLDPLFDKFLETLQGELNEKINFVTPINFTVNSAERQTLSNINYFLQQFETFLSSELKSMVTNTKAIRNSSSLVNIIEEILAEIQKTRYLLTFN